LFEAALLIDEESAFSDFAVKHYSSDGDNPNNILFFGFAQSIVRNRRKWATGRQRF
jgi:hypothetical protein